MDIALDRIVCGILTVVLFGLIVMRRRQQQKLSDQQYQPDLVEYALLAGFIAVAAGVLLPAIADDVRVIFSKIGSVFTTG